MQNIQIQEIDKAFDDSCNQEIGTLNAIKSFLYMISHVANLFYQVNRPTCEWKSHRVTRERDRFYGLKPNAI